VYATRALLMGWFDRSKRDLPWRRTRDPYAIWVSEVMLQQTQVSVVERYWAAFLKRFPTVEKLAAAQLDEVLSAWKGLGYYARARNLHRAAQVVAAEHGGKLPRTLEGLRTLPGFGRYTAGAVASIAFGIEAPIVDGNVARVLSRLFVLHGAPGDKAREAKLWSLAGALAQGERPGALNESLMELGATVCLPRSPLCLVCPVQSVCGASAKGLVDVLPEPKARMRKQTMQLSVALVRRKDETLFARRHDRGLFGGLWELPAVAQLGAATKIGKKLATVQRTLTHRELTIDVYSAIAPPRFKGPEGYADWKWADETEARRLGVSAAMQAAIRAAQMPEIPASRKIVEPMSI
jgi:A/G-specific adenine glycosylase